jgi:O-antigen/teichoic acid export membrane protein
MLFGTLFFQLDTILLALWRGDLAVGMYQAVMRIVIIVLVVPDIIVSAVLPTLAKLHVDDEKRWKEMGRLLAKTLMYFGLPFGVIFFVYADQVISLAYGSSRFTESIPVLRLFALIVVIRYAGEAYALLLTTSQQQSKRTATTIASTVLNVVLNAYAIPRYGIEGAAGVSLITNVFAVFAYVFLLDPRFHLPVVRIDFRQWLVVALTATFATLLWNFGHHLVALELGLMVGFFLIMYLFVGFSPEEKSLIFAMRQQVA